MLLTLSFRSLGTDGMIPVKNAALFYTIMGSGDTVLVLHGGPGLDHSYLLPQFSALAEHFTVVMYDQRAVGGSTGVADSASASPDVFVEDLERVRQYFHLDRVTLIGHSWGALLALHYAARYPARIERLILANAPGPSSDYFPDFQFNRALRTTYEDSVEYSQIVSTEKFVRGESGVMERYLRVVFSAYLHDRSNLTRLTTRLHEQTAQNLLPIFMNSLKHYPFDLRRQLATLESPVLILHGTEDIIPMKYAEELQRTIPRSTLQRLEACGHFPFVERESEFFRLITDFLETRDR